MQAGSGSGFFAVLTSSPAALAILAMMLPNFFLSAWAPFVAPPQAASDEVPGARLAAAGVLPLLGVSLAIKVLHLPERWFGTRGTFDFSPLHSHAIWHTGVFLCQLCYHRYFTLALAASASQSASGWLW